MQQDDSLTPQSARSDSAESPPKVLATDLDGTLIPLDGDPQNQSDLQNLTALRIRAGFLLVYVTGRHLSSVRTMMELHCLPRPDWIICDVGTTICRCDASGEFQNLEEYSRHLQFRTQQGSTALSPARSTTAAAPAPSDVASASQTPASSPQPGKTCSGRSPIEHSLSHIQGLRLQEPEKQGPFKISYYTDGDSVSSIAAEVTDRLDEDHLPWSVLASIDPFNGDGLIDVLPRGVSKAFALDWWSKQIAVDRRSIVFAGDSGNDVAALTAGYRTIVVGNASREITETVRQAHATAGWSPRLFLASQPATSGVLEGCRHFGLVSE